MNSLAAIILSLSCLSAAQATSPADPARIFFDRISVESGLSQSIVTALL